MHPQQTTERDPWTDPQPPVAGRSLPPTAATREAQRRHDLSTQVGVYVRPSEEGR